MCTSAQVSRVTDAVPRFSARSLVGAAPMSVGRASVRRGARLGPWRRASFAGHVGASESPQRRSVQHEASVLRHVVVRRARGRRHEHHYAERCSP